MEITSVDGFLRYWGTIRARTRRVLDAIPPERIDWSYAEGRWTLGDLVRHLALLERWMFAENVHGRPSLYAGCGPEHGATKDEVLALFDRLGDETATRLGALDDAALQGRCRTPGGAELAVWKWLRAMVEHHVHHRGQIYLYLALLDVPTPPLYGLTAEEVEARSGGAG
ncbi:MAG: DinB family protein [Acidobacteriota bacterium]